MSDRDYPEQIVHALSWATSSLRRLEKEAAEAITHGRELRPTTPPQHAMRRAARRLRRVAEDPEIFDQDEPHEHEDVLKRWFGGGDDG